MRPLSQNTKLSYLFSAQLAEMLDKHRRAETEEQRRTLRRAICSRIWDLRDLGEPDLAAHIVESYR